MSWVRTLGVSFLTFGLYRELGLEYLHALICALVCMALYRYHFERVDAREPNRPQGEGE